MNRITRIITPPAPSYLKRGKEKALLILAGICGAVVMWAMIILLYAGFEMLAWTGGR